MRDSLYLAKVAVYPGSFDPITLGHLDIINRASNIFDKLIILVLNNYRKKPLFSMNERVELIKKCIPDNNKVLVDSYTGLLVDYIREKNISFIVKGIRTISDFEYEFQQYLVNSRLINVETILLMTKSEYNFLSSSLVKEIAFFGGDISNFVPQPILKDILAKMDKLRLEVD
ncbi:MAG: pantetheine-phosphate adenylyltransferase [Candidatus Calescibacterium sp.]|nr:pantetheine-phosphate adenylyltransferase [Candidatus Calescibacterium sp.]MDW8194683.1 pantetheine-phosphate adenylyltransferase [Candidatus Calescibacterium sp.]